MLRRRKLLEIKKRLESKAKEEKKERERVKINPEQVLNRFFTGRAWEVLRAARFQYPQAAREIERALVRLILSGRVRSKITGEELYGLFYRLGFRVHLETRIRVLEHGKLKSLEEKIREETS